MTGTDMTDQNTRPTPSSDVARHKIPSPRMPKLTDKQDYRIGCMNGVDAYRKGWNAAVRAFRAALSAPPAQVEVTDEMVCAYKDAFGKFMDAWLDDKDPLRTTNPGLEATRVGLTAALTATDAKPVGRVKVPAGQTPLDDNLRHPLLDVINEGAASRDSGTVSPYHGHSLEHCLHATGWVQRDLRLALDAARSEKPVVPAEDVDRLSADDLQTLIQVRDRRHSIIESSTDRLLQAFALSDRGLLALEQLPSGADLHITRKGRKAIDAALASEGKTDA